jgi:hypothetical protein
MMSSWDTSRLLATRLGLFLSELLLWNHINSTRCLWQDIIVSLITINFNIPILHEVIA